MTKLIILLLGLSFTSFAKWEPLVEGKHKVWKSSSFKKVYIANSGKFLRRDKSKVKLLELFHLTKWKVDKETSGYIVGTYFDSRNNINYFLESKGEKSFLISTINGEYKSRLPEIFKNFQKEMNIK